MEAWALAALAAAAAAWRRCGAGRRRPATSRRGSWQLQTAPGCVHYCSTRPPRTGALTIQREVGELEADEESLEDHSIDRALRHARHAVTQPHFASYGNSAVNAATISRTLEQRPDARHAPSTSHGATPEGGAQHDTEPLTPHRLGRTHRRRRRRRRSGGGMRRCRYAAAGPVACGVVAVAERALIHVHLLSTHIYINSTVPGTRTFTALPEVT